MVQPLSWPSNRLENPDTWLLGSPTSAFDTKLVALETTSMTAGRGKDRVRYAGDRMRSQCLAERRNPDSWPPKAKFPLLWLAWSGRGPRYRRVVGRLWRGRQHEVVIFD